MTFLVIMCRVKVSILKYLNFNIALTVYPDIVFAQLNNTRLAAANELIGVV